MRLLEEQIKAPIIFESNKKRNSIARQEEVFKRFKTMAPEERYTSIASYKTILDITQLLKLEKLQIIQKIALFDVLLNPYHFVRLHAIRDKEIKLAPTIYYLKKLAQTKREKKSIQSILSQSEGLDVTERIHLGLTLTPDEINSTSQIQKEYERMLEIKK